MIMQSPFELPTAGRSIQFGTRFPALRNAIDQLRDPVGREWAKVRLLQGDADYMSFLSRLAALPAATLAGMLDDFVADKAFQSAFAGRLSEFESLDSLVHGDLRFHALSLYALIRAWKPNTVIETGVASGKSSTAILLALNHNDRGRLFSIDLPNPPGHVLPDGAETHTGGRPVGWLAPEYLRSRWTLILEDSRQALPDLIREIQSVDVFLHDSLHTNAHVAFELGAALPAMTPDGLMLLDNADMAQRAITDFLVRHDKVAYLYRDFAGIPLRSRSENTALLDGHVG